VRYLGKPPYPRTPRMVDGPDVRAPGGRLVDGTALWFAPRDDTRRVSAVRRDARDVHADDRGAGGGGGQAGSVHEQALAAGALDLGRHRAADAGVGGRAGGARVGRVAP